MGFLLEAGVGNVSQLVADQSQHLAPSPLWFCCSRPLVTPTEAPETLLAFFTSFLKSHEESDLLMGISESGGS